MYGEPYGYGATTALKSGGTSVVATQPLFSTDELIQEIRGWRVTNAAQMATFMNMVCGVINKSPGVDWTCTPPPGALEGATIPKMAKTFGKLKSWAEEINNSNLADAITQAAKWFWINVEKPFLKTQPKPKGSIPGLPPTSANPAAPFIQKPWYPYALVGTLVVGTGLFIAYRKKKA